MLKLASALVIGTALSALVPRGAQPATQIGPDLSGRWNRESGADVGTGPGTTNWGSRVEIGRSGTNVTVRTESGKVEEYRPDGTETAEVLWVKGCANQARITKYQPSKDRVTITTWIVLKSGCYHGETDDEPFLYRTGPVQVREIPGTRRLESVTDVYRDGDVLRVDTTRAGSTVGAATTSTTTTYRK